MGKPSTGPKWHRLYYLLALFDVLVVLFGLGLNHLIASAYDRSVSQNAIWDRRLDGFLVLGDLAANVNAPGNNVFETGNVAEEAASLQNAVAAFHDRLATLRTDLYATTETQEADRLGASLSQAEQDVREMTAEAEQIFALFRAGDREKAGTHMALMDRKYQAVQIPLRRLRMDVNAIQDLHLREQQETARQLRQFERVIGSGVLCMIAFALFYGHKIKNQLENAHRERELHIVQLVEAEASLREARDGLERKVAQRTEDLAQTNDALRAEVAERVRAEAVLKSYAVKLEQSNRELQDFAHVASHDLQEPLRKVQAFADRLVTRFGPSLTEEARDYLGRMQAATRRMQTLINDLLTFARVTSKGQPFEPVDLRQVTKEVIDDLEVRVEQVGATIDVDGLMQVEADPLQMRQLLQNLLSNALKFRRPDVAPRIRITSEAAVHDGAPGEVCRLRVEDNGIGFEEKYVEKIFTVFQRLHGRTEYEGSGVGLAVCRKIVERHGGSITAQSAPGQGSTFVVTLPTRQSQEEVRT